MDVQGGIFLFSCLLLALGADRLVTTGLFFSRYYRWDPRVVAVLLMGFATSFPELVVSGTATLQGAFDIAVGNAIGSNIINIGLVLALFVLCRPLVFTARVVLIEVGLLLGISVLWLCAFYQGQLTPLFSVISVAFFVIYVGLLCYQQSTEAGSMTVSALKGSPGWAAGWGVVSLAAVLVSSHYLIESATALSVAWGVDQRIMGVVCVALGTSLPELSVTLASLVRGEPAFALGNVVGSNVFNSLVVLAAPALLAGRAVPAIHFILDGWVMLAFTGFLLVVLCAQYKKTAYRIGRMHGVILLISLLIYLYFLWFGDPL